MFIGHLHHLFSGPFPGFKTFILVVSFFVLPFKWYSLLCFSSISSQQVGGLPLVAVRTGCCQQTAWPFCPLYRPPCLPASTLPSLSKQKTFSSPLTWKNDTFKLLVKLKGKKNRSTLSTSLHHPFTSENILLNSLLRVYGCHFTELLGDGEQWDAAPKPALQTSQPVILASLLLVLIQAEEYKNTAVLPDRSCSLHQFQRMAGKCWLYTS